MPKLVYSNSNGTYTLTDVMSVSNFNSINTAQYSTMPRIKVTNSSGSAFYPLSPVQTNVHQSLRISGSYVVQSNDVYVTGTSSLTRNGNTVYPTDSNAMLETFQTSVRTPKVMTFGQAGDACTLFAPIKQTAVQFQAYKTISNIQQSNLATKTIEWYRTLTKTVNITSMTSDQATYTFTGNWLLKMSGAGYHLTKITVGRTTSSRTHTASNTWKTGYLNNGSFTIPSASYPVFDTSMGVGSILGSIYTTSKATNTGYVTCGNTLYSISESYSDYLYNSSETLSSTISVNTLSIKAVATSPAYMSLTTQTTNLVQSYSLYNTNNIRYAKSWKQTVHGFINSINPVSYNSCTFSHSDALFSFAGTHSISNNFPATSNLNLVAQGTTNITFTQQASKATINFPNGYCQSVKYSTSLLETSYVFVQSIIRSSSSYSHTRRIIGYSSIYQTSMRCTGDAVVTYSGKFSASFYCSAKGIIGYNGNGTSGNFNVTTWNVSGNNSSQYTSTKTANKLSWAFNKYSNYSATQTYLDYWSGTITYYSGSALINNANHSTITAMGNRLWRT